VHMHEPINWKFTRENQVFKFFQRSFISSTDFDTTDTRNHPQEVYTPGEYNAHSYRYIICTNFCWYSTKSAISFSW